VRIRPESAYHAPLQHPAARPSEDESSNETEGEIFAAFDRWIEDYVPTLSDPGGVLRLREGQALAVQRRSALAELIQSDPERAIGLAVPIGTRQKLPRLCGAAFGRAGQGRGRFDVVAFMGVAGRRSNSGIERFVTINDRTFQAFSAGAG
jgi:hypothetical protein